MHEYMKTITLDEAAYARLKLWKRGPKESFSSVVKKVVPLPGTMGAFLSYIESNHTATLPGNEILQETTDQRTAIKTEPWT